MTNRALSVNIDIDWLQQVENMRKSGIDDAKIADKLGMSVDELLFRYSLESRAIDAIFDLKLYRTYSIYASLTDDIDEAVVSKLAKSFNVSMPKIRKAIEELRKRS